MTAETGSTASVAKIPVRATLFSAACTAPYVIGMLRPGADVIKLFTDVIY